MSIVLTASTGHIGGHLAEKLLNAGATVTVINRSAEKVQHLAKRGARVVVGSVDQAQTFDAAFEGATSVHWLTPPVSQPNYHEWAINNARIAAAAAQKHGVTRVVINSSVGVQAQENLGALSSQVAIEDIFKAVIPNVVALRPGFFFENVLNDVPSVAHGTVYTPFPPSTAMPWVATADIANRAASFLLSTNWRGHHTVGVHGPNNFTIDAAWAVISNAIDRPINVVHVPVQQHVNTLAGYGLPPFVLAELSGMWTAFIDGRAWQAEPNTPDTFGPTTLHEWAIQVFKPAVEAAISGAAAAAPKH